MKVASQLQRVVERRGALSLFEGRGTNRQPLSLLEAIYFDNTERAKAIIKADPSQINQQDSFAGLTPLHVAIFRQNLEVIKILLSMSNIDVQAVDGFGRRAVDLSIYTANGEIYGIVIDKTYHKSLANLSS